MAVEIKMPPLSTTTDEVKIVNWIVKEGDTVKKGDPLCAIETDKSTMDLESVAAGTVLKLLVAPGAAVPVGSVIAVIGGAGELPAPLPSETAARTGGAPEASRAAPSYGAAAKPQSERARGLRISSDGIKATSLVRNIAQKRGINLASVQGTGPCGLITKEDLERYVKGASCEPVTPPDAWGAAAFLPAAGPPRAAELSRNQLAVARALSRSKSEIPHFYVKSDVYMEQVMRLRETEKNSDGSKYSMYSFFVYAAARALRQFPRVNGYFSGERMYMHPDINVCCAVAAGEELFVPVVKNADRKSLSEIDREVKWLVAKAQNGKLEAQDISGGTFTLSNLGAFPVDEFSAIITPGQAGILAFGTLRKALRIDEQDAMSIRRVCTVTGSFDHRIVNGASAAAFLAQVKKELEEVRH